jgi:hypothetical protein
MKKFLRPAPGIFVAKNFSKKFKKRPSRPVILMKLSGFALRWAKQEHLKRFQPRGNGERGGGRK